MKVNTNIVWIFIFLIIGTKLTVFGIIINVPNGKLNGTRNLTRAGTIFYSFYAVRYARPPVGELRFQPPEEEQPWEGIYNATRERNICYQVTSDSDLESEDCLFANIFTPKNLSSGNFSPDIPVMVYIHGGGFVAGSGLQSAWGPKFFMDYGVILVTFNYRLGPFGFLSTGDYVIPGNMGLKDQVMLLKWIQQNIEHFGGDRRKVTIFGESSGGGSVGYLVLSPMAKGLFRAAIHQSGSGLSPLAYQRYQTDITYLTAGQINSKCFFVENNRSIELLNFLKTFSAKDLDTASKKVSDIFGPIMANVIQLTNGFFYAPVIESKSVKNAFITDKMYQLFQSGLFNKVPVILGVNGDEALALLYQRGVLQNVSKNYDNYPTLLVSQNMHISNDDTKKMVGDLVKSFFTNNSIFQKKSLFAVNFHSSHNLEKPVIKQAELQADYVPVRFYQFNYSGKMGNNEACVLPGTTNVSHGEELNYLFSRAYNSHVPDNTDLSKFSEQDGIVHKRIITLWTNFAKYLDPTPISDPLLQNIRWPTVQPQNFFFLNIEKNLKVEKGFPKKDSYEFWNRVYQKFAIKPYDSY